MYLSTVPSMTTHVRPKLDVALRSLNLQLPDPQPTGAAPMHQPIPILTFNKPILAHSSSYSCSFRINLHLHAVLPDTGNAHTWPRAVHAHKYQVRAVHLLLHAVLCCGLPEQAKGFCSVAPHVEHMPTGTFCAVSPHHTTALPSPHKRVAA